MACIEANDKPMILPEGNPAAFKIYDGFVCIKKITANKSDYFFICEFGIFGTDVLKIN